MSSSIHGEWDALTYSPPRSTPLPLQKCSSIHLELRDLNLPFSQIPFSHRCFVSGSAGLFRFFFSPSALSRGHLASPFHVVPINYGRDGGPCRARGAAVVGARSGRGGRWKDRAVEVVVVGGGDLRRRDWSPLQSFTSSPPAGPSPINSSESCTFTQLGSIWSIRNQPVVLSRTWVTRVDLELTLQQEMGSHFHFSCGIWDKEALSCNNAGTRPTGND